MCEQMFNPVVNTEKDWLAFQCVINLNVLAGSQHMTARFSKNKPHLLQTHNTSHLLGSLRMMQPLELCMILSSSSASKHSYYWHLCYLMLPDLTVSKLFPGPQWQQRRDDSARVVLFILYFTGQAPRSSHWYQMAPASICGTAEGRMRRWPLTLNFHHSATLKWFQATNSLKISLSCLFTPTSNCIYLDHLAWWALCLLRWPIQAYQ